MDDELISAEFPHLQGSVYLDHAGTTLYAKSQIDAYHKDLSSNLYGNPHSPSPSSLQTTEAIEQVRTQILSHFGTDSDHYDVIFTSGCTSALHLLSEAFPWTGGSSCNQEKSKENNRSRVNYVRKNFRGLETTENASDVTSSEAVPKNVLSDDSSVSYGCSNLLSSSASVFCYLEDNHTSVVGIREVAASRGAQLFCVDEECIMELNKSKSPQFDFQHDLAGSDNFGSPPQIIYHLFAYPAQSNFNGRKYPLAWVEDVPSRKAGICGLGEIGGEWLVLLDAAGFVSTSPLNLSKTPAHFVSLSFYKIFGFPTGLGALLVRQDIGHVLEKRYFGGGTVVASISRKRFQKHRPVLHERFEDGTVSFLDILALRHGFEALERFGLMMTAISQHTFNLAFFVYTTMAGLSHSNGAPLCILYHEKEGFSDINKQGGVVTFNLLRMDGSIVGYSEVNSMASLCNIHLRTGCFCNSGSCQRYLGLSSEQIVENMEAGHSCGDDIDVVNGRPTGCVRVSFGYMSSWSDARRFLEFLTKSFLQRSEANMPASQFSIDQDGRSYPVEEGMVSSNSHDMENVAVSSVYKDVVKSRSENHVANSQALLSKRDELMTVSANESPADWSHVMRRGSDVTVVLTMDTTGATPSCGGSNELHYQLQKVVVYPVKSCAGMEVDSWPVGVTGLRWDREWMVIKVGGACLSQKQEPKLALIKPCVDPCSGELTLSVNDGSIPELTVDTPSTDEDKHTLCNTRVCADKVQGIDCGDNVAEWLTNVLKRNCRLVKMNPSYSRKGKAPIGGDVSLSLSNQAQYLLVTMDSIQHFHQLMARDDGGKLTLTVDELAMRFRPNLIVSRGDSVADNSIPFLEDDWKSISVGGMSLQVVGRCTRCHMICIDQSEGSVDELPLKTLKAVRGSKATFGIYLSQTCADKP